MLQRVQQINNSCIFLSKKSHSHNPLCYFVYLFRIRHFRRAHHLSVVRVAKAKVPYPQATDLCSYRASGPIYLLAVNATINLLFIRTNLNAIGNPLHTPLVDIFAILPEQRQRENPASCVCPICSDHPRKTQ